MPDAVYFGTAMTWWNASLLGFESSHFAVYCTYSILEITPFHHIQLDFGSSALTLTHKTGVVCLLRCAWKSACWSPPFKFVGEIGLKTRQKKVADRRPRLKMSALLQLQPACPPLSSSFRTPSFLRELVTG